MVSRTTVAVVVLALVCAAQSFLPVEAMTATGLSRGFHAASCLDLEDIVEDLVAEAFRGDVGVAPALIHILFHDCFPQGCDASVLLTRNNSELNAVPNQTLHPVALDLIERIRTAVHGACGPTVSCADITVSCADITVFATRDALVKAGGPHFDVVLGRRDALTPASQDLVNTLPAPFFDVPRLISSFKNRSLDTADLVSLSGAHTFGIAHCPSFSDRFTPGIDINPFIDQIFARKLRAKCAKDLPKGTVNQTIDVRMPNVFDNKYYFNLMVRQGLFKSDQGLIDHPDTRIFAMPFVLIQSTFFKQFAKSMVKMSNMNLLIGTEGEIRRNCAIPNKRVKGIETTNDDGHTAAM